MTDLQWLKRISHNDVTATEQTRLVVETSAFKLLLDPHNDFAGVNWASPLKADPSQLEIEIMINAFRTHDRTPRLEFIDECWSGLPALLEAAGFQSEGEPQDIMLVLTETFAPFYANGVNIQFLESTDADELYTTYLETQTKGFGYGDFKPATAQQISSLRDQIRSGRRAALGLLEGQAAGVGTSLGNELSEVQGVTTLPDVRRQGVAATISSALVADVFAQNGNAVWLSVEETAARACYTKIGFQMIGKRLNYSLV